MPGAEPAPVAGNKGPMNALSGELVSRVLSAALLAPIAVAAVYLDGIFFAAFWLIAAIGIWWEWNGLVSGPGHQILLALGTGGLILAMSLAYIGRTRTPMLIVALSALGTGVFAPSARHVWAAGGLLYAGAVLLSSLALRRDPELGFEAMIFLFAVVWTTDILAYFSGKAIGGPKLAPAISPHKTWAGAVGGAAGAVIAGVAVAKFAGLENLAAIGVIALALSISAQLGDLFESAIKRRFGVKDASHLIPGHGGFMDRLDGYAAAATVAAIFGSLRDGLDAAGQGLLQW